MQTNLYSIVFHPSARSVEAIRNLDGHLAVNTFTADALQLPKVISYLEDFARRAKPDPVAVHKAETRSHTVKLLVEESSAARLRLLMASLNHSFPVRACKIYDPQIAIARSLATKAMHGVPEQCVGLELDCDSISLRQFDPYRQRYRKVRDFVFSGLPGGEQLSLF